MPRYDNKLIGLLLIIYKKYISNTLNDKTLFTPACAGTSLIKKTQSKSYIFPANTKYRKAAVCTTNKESFSRLMNKQTSVDNLFEIEYRFS